MPQPKNSDKLNIPHPFCNDIIFELVCMGLLSGEEAIQITQKQYEESALSEEYVQELVYQEKMSGTEALDCSFWDYQNSALSYPSIQNLVDDNLMSVLEALSISSEEYEESALSARYIQYLVYQEKMSVREALDCSFWNYQVSALSYPYIQTLVDHNLMTVNQALSKFSNEYEKSALSDEYVQYLVNQRKIAAISVLNCNLSTYQNSALACYCIQLLVEHNIMQADRALTICRDEIEDPVSYLSGLSDEKTLEQTRKLQLYESDHTLTSAHVEHIIILEFKQGSRDPSEERMLSLLLTPELRRHAIRIVNLEFFSDKTPRTQRELELLNSRYSRDYVDLILDLEFKENKSADDEIYLQNLYLRVCCRLPRKNPVFSLFQAALREEFGIDDAAGPEGCHSQAFYGGLGFGLSQHDSSERKHMRQMKGVFEAAAKQIVMVQLDVRGVPSTLRETDAMRNYILIKTDFLYFTLMKYFVGSNIHYSKSELDAVVEKVSQRIRNKTLTLSDTQQLLAIRHWVDEEMIPRCAA